MYFLEGNGQIRIEGAIGTSFQCPVDVFSILEPDYIKLVLPYLSRIWRVGFAAKKDGKNQIADEFYSADRFVAYVGNIDSYQATYTQKYACLNSSIITSICSYESGWQAADQHLYLSQSDFDYLDPAIHASGVPRWIEEVSSPEISIDGVGLRVRTTAEMQAFQEYLDWETEQSSQAAQSQAQADFGSMPDWVLNGTLAQAETHIDTNVVDLPSAKTVLKQMAKLFILIRDYIRIRG